MSNKTEFTHRIMMPCLNELISLVQPQTGLIFRDLYAAHYPQAIDRLRPSFEMYAGFTLYAEERLSEYFSKAEHGGMKTRVAMGLQPFSPIETLAYFNGILFESPNRGMFVDFTAHPGFDLNKFRTELPQIMGIELISQKNNLSSWSDLLIEKLTPEGYSLATLLPLAPRNARQGGLYLCN